MAQQTGLVNCDHIAKVAYRIIKETNSKLIVVIVFIVKMFENTS